MGKSLRRVRVKLNARVRACVEARKLAVQRNAKLVGVIDKAWKMPGSQRLD